MKKRWIASFALSLGFLANAAQAGDDLWRNPPKAPVQPAATIGRPVVDAGPAPLPPLVDSQVRPTAYPGAPAVMTDPVMRTQGNDPNVARPLPVGTPSGNPHTFVKDDSPSTSIGKPTVVDDGNTLPLPHAVESSGYTSPLWARFSGAFTNWGGGSDCGDGGDCASGTCHGGNCESGCCANNRWYVTAEGLVWWMKGNRVPPLVTTGSANDAVPGALGQPGTQVLFGGSEFGSGADGGGRVMIGYWFTPDHCLGFEAGAFVLGSRNNNFSASSLGDPLLFRPFTNETGAQDVELVAVPSPTGPGLVGTVSVSSRTSFWGAEGNFRSNLWCGPTWFIDGLVGFRALGLDDDLSIRESLLTVRGVSIPDRNITVPAGTAFSIEDRFRTTNRFYGGQVGLDMECRQSNWIFGLKTKLALGATSELAEVSGHTTISVPGQGVNTYNGGLLTQNSNIGHYSRESFSVVPEVGLTVGYQFNEHWRAFVGYNVIYWSNVARSGDQIDTVVNRNQLPPPVGAADRPAFVFHNTDFWAQGINFGIQFTW